MAQEQTVTEKLDQIRRRTERGAEYWHARDIRGILGYKTWQYFLPVIEKAMKSFEAAGEVPEKHFVQTHTMMELGHGAMREGEDYFLSRGACYIIAMNGDRTKPEIAEAQRYFAIRTRQMEKVIQLVEDQRRVELRKRVKDHNKELGTAAKDAGVKRFGLFHGAGIHAMYDMPLGTMKAKRGIDDTDWLSRAGIEELAANDFRITQTQAKIRRESVRGEQCAIDTHSSVGKEVRGAIRRMGGTMPENLPVEPPIKDIEKRLSHRPKPLEDDS